MTMAAAAAAASSIIPTLSSTPPMAHSPSPSLVIFNIFPGASLPLLRHKNRNTHSELLVKAQTLEFSGSFFESRFEGDDDPPSIPGFGVSEGLEDKEEPQCPPGLRQYETMAVLRPDLSEEERLTLIQKYEELLVAGGGMYVEVFNRGVIPLAFSVKKKNKAGETNTYMDGIYLLFTYFTKPESLEALDTSLNTDDNVIRSSSFKIRKRKF